MKRLKFLFIAIITLGGYGFAIGQNNACLQGQEFKIVVLGSSTAAGSGTSNPDSAWVNKYRSHLEDINANNEVINLAVGGYNTYKIMQTGFVQPSNRPSADTLRNITKALSLNPDGIIVNMPSNDVAGGFTVAEQMQNLNAIYQLSVQAGVPMWICTTQPRNFSTAQAQLQEDIKDSIYADFAPFVIDFWTTIATPANLIDPLYNSGDGVHLNDLGHELLFTRVTQTNILDHLFTPLSYTDFLAKSIEVNISSCGDSITEFEFVYANVGQIDSTQTQVAFHLGNGGNGMVQTDTLMLTSILDSCQFDTVTFIGNTYLEGNYSFTAVIINANDSNSSNDTLIHEFKTLGHPSTGMINDTLCSPGRAEVHTLNSSNDVTLWYSNLLDTTVLATGANYLEPYVDTTTNWFAQTIRGNRYHTDRLVGSTNSSINWNGTMFNLVSSTDLYVDSLDLVINTLGNQSVEVYTRSGSYVGFETDPNAWVLWGAIPINVVSTTQYSTIGIGGLHLVANDTTGIYIQLVDPNVRLAYQYRNSPVARSNSELTMISGTGVSHNFSATYFPRDWKGNVYYHYGSKPLGDCSTERIKATAFLSETNFALGTDTIIDIEDTLFLVGPLGMSGYHWSNGDSANFLQFVAEDWGVGIHHVNLEVMDSLGCLISEGIVIGVADLVSVNEVAGLESISVYPNPTSGLITIELESIDHVELYSINGDLLKRFPKGRKQINLYEVIPGVYLLKVFSKGVTSYIRVIKQ